MSRQGGVMRISDEEILDAIRGSRGNYSLIQDQTGLTTTVLKRRIRDSPILVEAYEDEYSTIFNLAEDKLVKAIEEEQAWAIKFYLSTQGAKFGYSYKQEILGGDRVVVINWTEATTPQMEDIDVIEVTDGGTKQLPVGAEDPD